MLDLYTISLDKGNVLIFMGYHSLFESEGNGPPQERMRIPPPPYTVRGFRSPNISRSNDRVAISAKNNWTLV